MADAAAATELVVERFGGIRPMAAKLDTPVTTVQGWKKRGIIPQSRHADILAAATREGIVLDPDILTDTDPGTPGRPEPRPAEPRPAEPRPAEPRPAEPAFAPRPEAIVASRPSRLGGVAVVLSLVALLGAAAAVAVIWEYAVEPLKARVVALEARPGASDDALARRVAALEAQLAATSSHAAQPSTTAATTAGSDPEKLAQLEQQVAELKTSAAETDQIAKRVSELQIAAGGREVLAQSIRDIQSSTAATQGEVERLAAQLGTFGGRIDHVEAAVADRRQQGLKAEAALLGIVQLGVALDAAKPFTKDMAALRPLIDGNAAMTAQLDLLQPLADDGVPTTDDLRTGFGRLAPEIVRSAVLGDGNEWWRQALYHIESVISIRRTGDAVPGDATDAVVARAEAKLDEDDLKGAVAALKPLDGLPAQTAQPWIKDAERRLTVDAAKDELDRLAVAQLASGTPQAAAAPPAAPSPPAAQPPAVQAPGAQPPATQLPAAQVPAAQQ